MGPLRQQENSSLGSFCEPIAQLADLIGLTPSAGGYTQAVTFGERLSSLRNQRNLTQEALANAAGVSKGQVSRWERGEDANPGLASIQCLADALDVHISQFFPRPDKMPGHDDTRAAVRPHPGLERLIEALDADPGNDGPTVETDILDAIATLTRALRRGRAATQVAGPVAKTRR